MASLVVTVERTVPADAQTIFDVLADPSLHPVIDGSGTVRAPRGRVPQRLAMGTTFGMAMHLGADYKILNTVVEFEEGRLIGWRHFNGHVWRYRLEPVPGGTRVVEEWDARRARNRLLLHLLGFPRRNRAGMRQTLINLEKHLTRR